MSTLITHPEALDRGSVLAPGDPAWDATRLAFNLLVQQRPESIAVPRTADEVAAVVAEARRRGLRLAPQSTGHNAGPLGPLDDTMIVNTSRLKEIRVDAASRRVRVGAATRWRDVTPQLSDLGLAALHGSSPDVGIMGYSLGGGIGWLARKHGMQTNAVTAIELVTADGALRRVDPDHEADLFWALRGGGGNFGVVTAVEFEVFRQPEVYAGAMFFPIERAAEVLHAWTALMPQLPEELTSWTTLLHFPPAPEVPEPVRGRSFVIVMAAHLGDEREGRALLAPLRRLGPELDTFATQAPIGLAKLAMDPEEPLPFRSATALLDGLPGDAIEKVAAVAGAGSSLAMVQLRHQGGALSRPAPGGGARSTLPGEVVMMALGVVPEPALEPVVVDQLRELSAAVAPRRVGDYPNFVEEPADASGFFDPATWRRLREVKAAYDPEDLFRANHHIPPAR